MTAEHKRLRLQVLNLWFIFEIWSRPGKYLIWILKIFCFCFAVSTTSFRYQFYNWCLLVKIPCTILFDPTPVGGAFSAPYWKMAITFKNNDPKEPKFSYTSMKNPPIPFWVLKMAKKRVFVAFLLSALRISGSWKSVF